MNRELVVAADIGSTYTKAALFRRLGESFAVEERASVPTTTEELGRGFRSALDGVLPPGLVGRGLAEIAAELPVAYSSSAKGGLAIAACGIVRELTAKMAEAAALSAGGRITSVYDYRLSKEDVDEINAASPDVLLLAGGTDGGNESYVLHNAAMLAELRPETVLIYAGNRRVRGEVVRALNGRECLTADNVLPALDRPEPEDARRKIREVFLERIVAGKGLATLSDLLGRKPLPTPYVVLTLVEAASHHGTLGDFVLIDMGGATTDVYSAAEEPPLGADRIRQGLPEPRIKRSVEGDLGLRINAAHAARALSLGDELVAYAQRLAAAPGSLPADPREAALERELAEALVGAALRRHAGSRRVVYTARGETSLIRGKDLSRVEHIVATGGYLSRQEGMQLLPSVHGAGTPGGGADSRWGAQSDEHPLLPESATTMRDGEYLIPLLANLAAEYPQEAAATLQNILTAEEIQSWNS